MAITSEDINLEKFLKNIAPASFPEAGKLTISDTDFLMIAVLFRIEEDIRSLKK